MDPVIFNFGLFSLNWYGVLIVGGAVIAAWLSNRYAVRSGENPDHVWNLLALTLVAGIIGARLYHVISIPVDGLGWPYYRAHMMEIVDFWSGGFRGLGIIGGLMGGAAALLIYCRVLGLRSLKYLDFIAPNILLAQAIGRVGNYINQELYGPLTDLPWAFTINPVYPCQTPLNLEEGIQLCGSSFLTAESLKWYANQGYHPTFFYEAGWNLLGFFFLTLLIRQQGPRLRRGDAFYLYLIIYSVGRIWTEAFRPDAWMIGSFAAAQWIAAATLIVSTAILMIRHVGWQEQGDSEESLVLMSRHDTPLHT